MVDVAAPADAAFRSVGTQVLVQEGRTHLLVGARRANS